MKKIFCLFFLFILFLISCSFEMKAQNNSQKILRPSDIVENPNNYLNRNIEVEIVEALYGAGATNTENLAKSETGHVEVMIPDLTKGVIFYLVPSSYKSEDPKRYYKKFEKPLHSPLRVKGELLRDLELERSYHKPVYVVRVASFENLQIPTQSPLVSLADLKLKPENWDRKIISYEGVYENRFEVSTLDKEIWLTSNFNTKIIGKAITSNSSSLNRVRVTGVLFAKPGAHYGHLGSRKYMLIASQLEYLGPP